MYEWPTETAARPSSGLAVMEVYPAAVLKSLGLPWRRYKGKDPGGESSCGSLYLTNLTGTRDKLRSVNRITIAIPELALPPHLEQLALACDDALDAVIAALGAAIAYLNPGQTAPPRQISADLIALEGWIYVTYPQTTEATS
jgi:predicted nuclease with RNAse H fold